MLVSIIKKVRQQTNQYRQYVYQFTPFLKMFSPLACVQLSQYLYKANHFFIQNAIKIYTKTHQL